MTIGKFISRITSLYEQGVDSFDSRLSPMYVYEVLKTARNTLYTRKANKNQKINNSFYQVLNCVELIEVDKAECPCILPTGCKVYRTKDKFPTALVNLSRHLIKSVTSIESSIMYDETNWEDLKFRKGRKYTHFKPEWYLRNNYLYFTTNQSSKYISLEGIFNDPIEAYIFGNTCNESNDCLDYNELEFPIDNELEEPLIKLAAMEISSFLRKPIINNVNNEDEQQQE